MKTINSLRWRTELSFAVGMVVVLLCATVGAAAQTYVSLFNYPDTTSNTSGIAAPQLMTQGVDGNLYSTINSDGTHNSGTAYRMTTTGTPTAIYNFCALPSCADGAFPGGGLTLGVDGNLYGTTATFINSGTVFKLTPTGTLSTLWKFTGGGTGTDEGGPIYTVLQGQDGNFYGVNNGTFSGVFGVFFKLTPKGKLTASSFNFTNGAFPNLPTQGLDGNFYGTTQSGGDATCRCGVVYKVTPAGKISVLHKFTGFVSSTNFDGTRPIGVLVQGNDGNLYGTTFQGGANNLGTVFKISTSGTNYSLVHSFNFTSTDRDGIEPEAGLTLGTDGNFYGTTVFGGQNDLGTIFQITPTGGETVEYSFCAAVNCPVGFAPTTSLIQHTNGKFYGNTSGNSLGGSVFYSFDMGLPPFGRSLSGAGKVGAVVGFLGEGLTSAANVSFNGIPATFKIVSDTFLTATVPVGALTGVVKILTSGGTLLSSHSFKVLPAIKTITPSGPVGSAVVITGSGLTQTTKVMFSGGKAAVFTVNNDGQITATVPTGAKTGHIVLTTPGGTASSPTSFTVTP